MPGPELFRIDLRPDVEQGRGELIGGNRGSSGNETLDARMGREIAREGEDIGMAHPAGKRWPYRIGDLLAGIDVSRPTRASAQVFIAAADRHVGGAASEIDRHGAGRM